MCQPSGEDACERVAAPGFKAATVTFRQEPILTAEKWHCEALWLTLARNALYASLSFSCITSCSDAKKKLSLLSFRSSGEFWGLDTDLRLITGTTPGLGVVPGSQLVAEMWDYILYSMNAPFGRTRVTRGWNPTQMYIWFCTITHFQICRGWNASAPERCVHQVKYVIPHFSHSARSW